MNVLTRVLKRAWEEAKKPETFNKGEEFEEYVQKTLFPQSTYDLTQKTHNYVTNINRFVETSKEPDFKFKSRNSGKDFFIEAKYRSTLHNGMLDWCKQYQFKRYQEIDKKIPVYIVIGTGKYPGKPEKVLLIPMKHIKYPRLYPSVFDKYQIPTHEHVTEKKLFNNI